MILAERERGPVDFLSDNIKHHIETQSNQAILAARASKTTVTGFIYFLLTALLVEALLLFLEQKNEGVF
jgi:hypothetical protein